MLISHFGTFDVENYGDLLFPLIVRERLKNIDTVDIEFVSPVGGEPVFKDCVQSIKTAAVLSRDYAFDAVIIGGGNIIHTMPSMLRDYRVTKGNLTAYSDLWVGASLNAPAAASVIWNAPGAPRAIPEEHYELVQQAMNRADYLSVRDEKSKKHLLDVCPEAEISVVPDSAWCLSDIWTDDELSVVYKKLLTKKNQNHLESTIAFHLNKRYMEGLTDKDVAKKIEQIALSFEAMPILLAIGNCHGDNLVAERVSKCIDAPHLLIDQPESLIDVAACISQSAAYVGSSMHGFITAAAFSIPCVCIAKKGKVKFEGLSEFVGITDLVFESWDEIAENISILKNTDRQNKILDAGQRARKELDVHWIKISEILLAKSAAKSQNIVRDSRSQERYLEHQRDALESMLIMLIRKNRDLSREARSAGRKLVGKEKELVIQTARVSKLKGNVNIYENSLSWKITKPLRYLASKSPFLAGLVSRVIRKFYRVLNRLAVVSRTKVEKQDWNPPINMVETISTFQNSSLSKNKKTVVYTAVYGGYDALTVPDQLDSNIDYICFTDQPINGFGVWEIRAAPYYHPDPTRMARFVKTHPQDLLSEYDIAVWVDANIVIRGDLWKYINKIKDQDADLGFVNHPLRDCVYDEAEACKQLNKDKNGLIDIQISKYKKESFPANLGMCETGFFVTKIKNARASSFFRNWWSEIEMFSKRDQLSVGWAILKSGVKEIKLMPNDVSVRNNSDFTLYRHEIARNFIIPKNLKKFISVKTPYDVSSFSSVKQKRLESVANKTVDIVVCVYNALEDVKLCLASAVEHLTVNANIILVNDVSNDETTEFLRQFAENNDKVVLIENEENLGYTKSANRGLQACEADFRIMLNSDTIVSKDWALKMMEVAYSSDSIGIVGPLSNAAGSQSVPNIKGTKGQTVINQLPDNISFSDLDTRCEEWSFAGLYPRVPLIHGFCFGIKKSVIDKIGYFDEVNFERYYGEENDYCFRGRAAGFEFAIATNTFVYHRKSRSIEEEERLIHMDKAGKRLRELYGAENVSLACKQMENHPLLIQIRNKASKYINN